MAIKMFSLVLRIFGLFGLKNFVNFQGKHPLGSAFLIKVVGYLTRPGDVFPGNLWNFQNSSNKKLPWIVVSIISCY